jgi:Truncated hemoglobins
LRQVHSKFHLEDKHFEAFTRHLMETLKEMEIDEKLIKEIAAIIEPNRREIVNEKRF